LSAGTDRSIGGMLAVALAALSWGTVGVVGQQIQRSSGLQSEYIAFFRLAIAVVCLSPSLPNRPRITRLARGGLVGVLVGVDLSLALSQLFYSLAIDVIGVVAAARLMVGLSPQQSRRS
jgi:drug/metabolite transporter (DMT)-like permease